MGRPRKDDGLTAYQRWRRKVAADPELLEKWRTAGREATNRFRERKRARARLRSQGRSGAGSQVRVLCCVHAHAAVAAALHLASAAC
jgi:hypothetical protein